MKEIDHFEGKYAFLSNFYSVDIRLGDLGYPSVEHAFQAAKTLDSGKRSWVRNAPTPGGAKRRGRQVPLRPDWEAVKVGVMRGLLEQKFDPELNPDLCEELVSTGDAMLIEGNTWGDSFWGCTWKAGEWYGENRLGKILMEVRAKYQNQLAEERAEEQKYGSR